MIPLGIIASSRRRGPPPSGSVLQFWYDADDVSTFTYDPALVDLGPYVQQWRDKSGFARHLTPRSGADFGTSTDTTALRNGTLNGRDVVEFRRNSFDRYGCRMRGASPHGEPDPLPFQGDYTVMAVYRWHSSMGTNGDGAIIVGFCTTAAADVRSSNGAMPVHRIDGWPATDFTDTTHQTTTLASTGFTFGTPYLRTVIKNGATLSVWENGTLVSTTTVSDHGEPFHRLSINTDPVSASSARCGASGIAELKGWQGALNTTERQAEEAALTAKWGLP